MAQTYKSIRLFDNPYLEKLTHVHPIVPGLLWGPVVAYLIWKSVQVHAVSYSALAGMAVFGIVAWTLFEYLLHRFIFHFDPGSSVPAERVQYLMHGLHHEDPVDPTRLVMPPVPAIILCIILYTLFRAVFGPIWVDPFFAFFIVGYLCYDYTHYAIHHFQPRTRFGKMMKQHHMMHHYATPNARWGVSSPVWDYVFGTLKATSESREHAV